MRLNCRNPNFLSFFDLVSNELISEDIKVRFVNINNENIRKRRRKYSKGLFI